MAHCLDASTKSDPYEFEGKESELIQWLNDNNFSDAIEAFHGQEISFTELLSLAEENDLKSYLHQLNLSKTMILRINSKIKKITKTNTVVHIIISEEENKAIQHLKEYNNKIAKTLQTLSTQQQLQSLSTERVKSEINARFNDLMNTINDKQQSILNQVDSETAKFQSEMDELSKSLRQKQEITTQAVVSCNRILSDNDMNNTDRQQQITSIHDNMVSEPVPVVSRILIQPRFSLGEERISNLLSDFCDIDVIKAHPVPNITDLKAAIITNNECTICWKAILKHTDYEKQYKYGKLFMNLESIPIITMNKDEIDEKEACLSVLKSDLILFESSKDVYEYTFKHLKKNQMYKLRLCFYGELMPNDDKECIDILDEHMISFKTWNANDFNDLEFKYTSDYDRNGICHFIGTQYGTTYWRNPAAILNKIKLKSSGWDVYESLTSMVEQSPFVSCSLDQENTWVVIDFGPSIKIKPTDYTLMHYAYGYYNCLLSWNLLGSIDGRTWHCIDKHWHWFSPFTGAAASKTFKILNCAKYYQLFKIQMTGKNSSGNWRLCCGCFEVYGYLTGNK